MSEDYEEPTMTYAEVKEIIAGLSYTDDSECPSDAGCSTALDRKIDELWQHCRSQFIPEDVCQKSKAYDEKTFKAAANRIFKSR